MYYDLMEDYGRLMRIRNNTDNPAKRAVYDNKLKEMTATMDYFQHHSFSDDPMPEHGAITPTFIMR